MKKFVAILAALMIAILALIPMTVAGAETADVMYIVAENGKTVNLRNNPDGTVLARLGVGMPVKPLSHKGDGWMQVSVQVNGKTLKGYVKSDFVSYGDPAEAPQTFVKVSSFKVTAAPTRGADGHVNLRAASTATSTCLTRLHKGDVLTVLAESNAWYQVRTANGTTGYVVKTFVTK